MSLLQQALRIRTFLCRLVSPTFFTCSRFVLSCRTRINFYSFYAPEAIIFWRTLTAMIVLHNFCDFILLLLMSRPLSSHIILQSFWNTKGRSEWSSKVTAASCLYTEMTRMSQGNWKMETSWLFLQQQVEFLRRTVRIWTHHLFSHCQTEKIVSTVNLLLIFLATLASVLL